MASVRRGRGKGFASMTTERRREVASQGGKTAHQLGTAHKWIPGDPDAVEAGKKGGSTPKRPRKQRSEKGEQP